MKELLKGIWCSNCESGTSLNFELMERVIEDKGEKDIFLIKYKCDCGHEFNLYEGIINYLLFDGFSEKLTCDYNESGRTEIIVGKEKIIKLSRYVSIKKVYLTSEGGFVSLSPSYFHLETDYFNIVSSEVESDYKAAKKIGEKLKVTWNVYGKTDDRVNETWLLLLTQIREQIQLGQYNTAILTSEMMFESYLDNALNKMLIAKGVSEKTSYVILESMKSIYDKAHKLLKELNGERLNGEVNKEWIKLLGLRNKIAHGENVKVDKEKAEWALKTALNAIFFIIITSQDK